MSDYIFYVKVANSKFVLDSVSQAEIALGHGLTYRFDQSDSSNGSHPLKLSTTTDGTHTTGGAEYTSGVTYNGTPGSSGAYTQIAVTSSTAANLYYYCSNHDGMGGSVITTGNTHVTTNNLGLLVPILADATDQWGSHINQSLRKLEDNFGANANVYTFSVSSTTSTISGAATIGGTLSFSAEQHVEVYLNGVKLVEKSGSTGDYTLTPSSNTITLESNVSSGDVIDVVCLKTFQLADAVPASGGNFTGAVKFNQDGNNTSFTLPTTRGTDAQVLTRTGTSGATTWSTTISAPSITNISGEINEDTNTTLTVTGSGFASGMTIKLINSSTGADITGHTTLSYTGSSSPITVTIPSGDSGKNITAGTSVKLHISKSGLTTESNAIVVSEDPNWATSPADSSTIATILSNLGTSVNVGSALSATAGAGGGTINYVIDPSDTSATTYFDLGLTSGQITTDASNALSGILGGANSATETFITYAQIAGEETTKKTSRTFNIIVNKAPTGGGTITEPGSYSGGGYRSHKFVYTTSSTTDQAFTLYVDTVVDIFMIAGGGGGGVMYGAGGGAGGVRIVTNQTLTAGLYNIRVGGGGIGGNSSTEPGGNGDPTSFINSTGTTINITATGGGGGSGNGANPGDFNGRNGGSGGGAKGGRTGGTLAGTGIGNGTGTFGSAAFQGYNGGVPNTNTADHAAGGGGAGGSPTTANYGYNGGTGITRSGADNWIDGSTGTTVGLHQFGGGGAGHGSSGTGTATFGGSNATGSTSSSGTANSGGGGGAGTTGGVGGTGIVVVRYAVT